MGNEQDSQNDVNLEELRFRFNRGNGRTIALIMRKPAVLRLSTTCFRGRDKRLAGNLKLYDNFSQVMDDQLVVEGVFAELDKLFEDEMFNATYSFTVKHTEPVGWSSTIMAKQLPGVKTEKQKLNKRSRASFVADPAIMAPLTHSITFICELKYHTKTDLRGAVMVHSLYPGPDVGDLRGDMTRETGMLWFPWTTPGGYDMFQD
jgi:hypothetical protein